MTKNEPIADISSTTEHACLLYNVNTNTFEFSSQPLEKFFGAALLPSQTPPFATRFDGDALYNAWQSACWLGENETRSFTIAEEAKPHQRFRIEIMRPPGQLFRDENIRMVTIAKQGTASSITENDYADFIALASHDLDSPLRKLSLFAERLFSRIATNTDGETQTYLQRMQSSLGVIRGMVEDLSQFARLNAGTSSLRNCDLNEILSALQQELEITTSPGEIQLEIGQLPTIEADNTQIKTLFRNLLDNAVKFKQKDIPLRVHISASQLNEEQRVFYDLPNKKLFHQVTVADNGIGFEQASAEKIFMPFVRLNGKSEYPGNGIGLAICKKIVENHRGIIYAEGKEQIGASFILILPQSPY